MLIKFSSKLFPKQKLFSRVSLYKNRKCNLCNTILENNDKKKIDYLLILDFEATCDKKKMNQEIIEFPCIKINVKTLREEARFHHYVRPVVNPRLTLFCIELTGILQEMVDDEKTFPEVYQSFNAWREKEGLTDNNSSYVTSGDWDLGHMMPKQCEISGINVPSHMTEWIDVKKLYANHTNRYYNSLIQIIESFDMKFTGRQHSGIDDCLNIFNVIKKLATLGVEFKPTTRLHLTERGHKVEVLRNAAQ